MSRFCMAAIGALAVTAGLTACGDSTDIPEGMEDIVSCERWLDEPVRAEWVANGCELDDTIYLSMTRECPDGSKLFYNDVATGKIGEPAVTIGPADTVPWLDCG